MKESLPFSENDLALINALQIRPRAEWSIIGRALGVNPVTVARRWQKLTASGVAWITAQFGRIYPPGCFADIAINCEPGFKEAVAAAVSRDPQTTSVEITTGQADLLCSVSVGDLTSFTRYLLDRVERLPGVTATRTSLYTRFYSEGSRWRIRALSNDQVELLRRGQTPVARDPEPIRLSDLDRKLFLALGRDGRLSHAELARQLDLSVATVRRRLDRLLTHGGIGVRCEVADSLIPWPLLATLHAQVSPGELDNAGRTLASFPETRLCVAVTGVHNLTVSVQLRDLTALHRLQVELAHRVPGVASGEWLLTLRAVKRMGRLLDDSGRSVAAIPMDLWAQLPNTQRE